MLRIITQWSDWLGNRMFFIVLSALLMGFCLPLPKTPLLTSLALVSFAYMTFVTALGTSFKEVVKVMKKPWLPLWILFLVHVGGPAISWIVGLIFYPEDQLIRLGLLIIVAIPVAVTSIIWTSLTKGNVPLALVVVTLDTFAVPFILPIFFLITVGQVIAIDYQNLILRLLFIITIPSIVGMILKDLNRSGINMFYNTVGGITAKVAMFLVVMLNSAMVSSDIEWNISIIKLLLVIFFLISSGYLLGFAGSFVLKERSKEVVIAMIYNVGMRNISFGSLLALAHFPSKVVITITLAMIFQQPVAAIVSIIIKKFLK